MAVHLATLVSILLVYRTRVTELVQGMLTGDRASWEYAGLIVVATIPAGLLGVFAKDRIEALFDNPLVPGIALIVTGAILWSSRSPIERAEDERPTWRVALLIGIAQAFALAFTLAAPFVVASLVYNVALGVINRAKLRFDYHIRRGDELTTEAEITCACADMDRMRICSMHPRLREALG